MTVTEIVTLAATLERTELEGVVDVRVVPYGVEITHHGETIRFARGSVRIPEGNVPVVVDHGGDAMSRIGVVERFADRVDGLYATLRISDTALGRDVLALIADGALTDVSAGVALDDPANPDRSGLIDHVAIVAKGAFGGVPNGSTVLAVHTDDGETTVTETQTVTETDPGPAVVDATVLELAQTVDVLRESVAELVIAGGPATTEPRTEEFADLRDFVLTLALAQRGDADAGARIESYVLADDTTTTASGVVPDFLSQRVLEIIDPLRYYLNTIQRDPIGPAGMSVVYPNVTQSPTVDVQADQKIEVASQNMIIGTVDVPLLTYAGASDVARQLVERSQPSFVEILFRHYANAYAQKTDGDAVDAGISGAATSNILADLGADASATLAAFNAANAAIIASVRKPATHVALSVDRWVELLSLADSDGRPLLVFPPNGPTNAQGQASLAVMSGQYHGLIAYVDPNIGTADGCLIYNADEYAVYLEQDAVQLRAEVVSLLGFDMGVYGLFAHLVTHDGAGSTLTAA